MNPPNQLTIAPTPRTDAAYFATGATMYSLAGEMKLLERELAAAKAECERLTANQRQPAEDIFVSHLCDELARLRAEVEQLNLELEANKLKGGGCQCSDDEACAHVRRAEKAEAELAKRDSEYLRGTAMVAESASVWQSRAEKAEAALAEAKVERETVAQSSLRSLESYIDKLKQFAERAERAEADNAKWQKLLLMSRDDREIDLISEIEEQARLLGMSGEREADLSGKLGRLESELAAIKNGHGELGKYEQLRLKNAELQRDKARLDWLAVSDTWFDYPATESFNPETFRDAIDAAMKGTP